MLVFFLSEVSFNSPLFLQTQQCGHQPHSGKSGGDFNLSADVGSVLGGAHKVSAISRFLSSACVINWPYNDLTTRTG